METSVDEHDSHKQIRYIQNEYIYFLYTDYITNTLACIHGHLVHRCIGHKGNKQQNWH